MFTSIKTYVSDRRSGVAKIAAAAGGFHVVKGYIRDRLEEVKDRLEQERVARDK